MQAPHLRERQAIKRRSRITDLHRRELPLISQNINIHTEHTEGKSEALSRVAMSSPSFTCLPSTEKVNYYVQNAPLTDKKRLLGGPTVLKLAKIKTSQLTIRTPSRQAGATWGKP